MHGAEGGGIFVSYRRQESSHLAGRLYDRLADRFGEGQVFIDVDTIEPGVDFAEEISRAVAACQVLLAVIGSAWLTAADERGQRRLDDPDDLVRLEIEAALARDLRIIPILVEGAVMPGRQDLPESLAGLARRNAFHVRHESFGSDAGRLVTAIERVLTVAPSIAAAPAVPDPHGVGVGGNASGEVIRQGPGPAGNDRATRLLSDAERLARSLTEEVTKSLALSGVAEALAATDPDRAAQLLSDAERTARSSTDTWSKALALGAIGGAVAATDPDHAAQLLSDAERIARSFAGLGRCSLLIPVVRALAATDPDRAEGIAQSFTDESDKSALMRSFAIGLAAADPDRAERIAQSLPDELRKAEALSGIAGVLAASDPDRAARLFGDAERIARSLPGTYKESALSEVAQALAATDPDRAERIAQSLTDNYRKGAVLREVARGLAATDPDRAERIAQSLTDEYSKALALSGIAKVLAAPSS